MELPSSCAVFDKEDEMSSHGDDTMHLLVSREVVLDARVKSMDSDQGCSDGP